MYDRPMAKIVLVNVAPLLTDSPIHDGPGGQDPLSRESKSKWEDED